MADTQATEQATEGFEYADPLASDKAVWALVGAVKNLGDQKALERDASTGRYSNESVAAMVDKHKTGLVYTFLIPAGSPTDIQPMSAAAKRVASTEFVPATATSAAVDPFDTEGGPWFHVSANAGADADGVPWVEAIDGVDYGFSRVDNGHGNNVYEIAPVVWQAVEVLTNGNLLVSWSDSRFSGSQPNPKALLPDGTLRPYMLTPTYPMSIDADGRPRSVSGAKVANRTTSHDSLVDLCKTATTGYSGMSVYDQWYINFHQLTKTLCKSSQVDFPGCTDFNIQIHPALAETGVTRVVVTAEQAAVIPVGASMMYGTDTGTTCPDRGAAAAYDVFDGAVVGGKETLADGNVALLMDVAKAFDTTVNTWLQSAPWCTGNTDALVGDGQVAKDGKHPYKVGGVETGLGLWEFMGDTLFVSDGTGFGVAVNPDTRNEKKNAVADGVTPTAACMPTADGYMLDIQFVNGLILGKGLGGSATTGVGDYFYFDTSGGKVKGTIRLVPFLGSLWIGSRAGLRCAVSGVGSGGATWNFVSRLSATGRSRG